MNTKSIEIDISIQTNGIRKTAALKGYGFIESGFLSGRIFPSSQMSFSEQVLVTAFSFTGCPIVARTDNPSLNPWIETRGSYKSTRTLNSSRFNVVSKLCSVGLENSIHMNIDLEVQGELVPLQSIKRPFQESIIQVSKGLLRGQFELIFNTNEDDSLPAVAVSEYDISVDKDVAPVWRNILILNSTSQQDFMQIEQIDLFGNKEVADKDLFNKSLVAGIQQ